MCNLEDRLKNIKAKAYGVTEPVLVILQTMTDKEIEETFSLVLEDMLQTGRELPNGNNQNR